MSPRVRRAYLSGIVAANAATLMSAIAECRRLRIGAFRITSQILPLATHPTSGYQLADLDDAAGIDVAFRAAGAFARAHDIRLSFHPDQFVVLNSERPSVVDASLYEIEMQASIAELIGADTVTLHGGGGAGGRAAALDRLRRGIDRLSDRARARLALENDDRVFTVADLLPVCASADVPLVYDVHHHRCHSDGLTIAEATDAAAATWGTREPYFHVSSPRGGPRGGDFRAHADYVMLRDVPVEWRQRDITVDVEAKAKERAVVRLRNALARSLRAAP